MTNEQLAALIREFYLRADRIAKDLRAQVPLPDAPTPLTNAALDMETFARTLKQHYEALKGDTIHYT